MLWYNTTDRNTCNLIRNRSYIQSHKYGSSSQHIKKIPCQATSDSLRSTGLRNNFIHSMKSSIEWIRLINTHLSLTFTITAFLVK